jgi:CheY-like chemotaxis protein
MTKARIMVVEDEGIVAMDIRNRLRRLGYEVPAIAKSGEVAIKKVVEAHPDLVLMDIMLKGDMDGIEASMAIQKLINVSVIYATASSDERTIQRAKTAGSCGYLIKPFSDDELQNAIKNALS